MSGDDTEQRGYASPACSMHEIDPAYLGLPLSPEAVALWRKGERARLIAMRLAMSAEERADRTRRIAQRLDALIGDPAGLVVSAYWPFRGEPDLRPWLEELRRRGARTALPVVVAMAAPLAFRSWRQGDRLERGVWNIPVPADGEVVEPQIALAPVVGYDAACYRLGYGGGFFDRTLARLPASTLAIGVGYAEAEIATIHAQPFDIPMRHVVTEAGTRAR